MRVQQFQLVGRKNYSGNLTHRRCIAGVNPAMHKPMITLYVTQRMYARRYIVISNSWPGILNRPLSLVNLFLSEVLKLKTGDEAEPVCSTYCLSGRLKILGMRRRGRRYLASQTRPSGSTLDN